MRDNRHGLQKRNIAAVLCLVLAAVSLALIAVSVAKYSETQKGDVHGAIPADFRLECSPYVNGLEYIVLAGDGETNNNITFTVESTAAVTVTCSDSPNSVKNNVTRNDTTYTIDAKNWKAGETYTVTVSTTEPYAKTISFTFRVVDRSAANYYTIQKNGSWVELTLYIGSTPPNLTIYYGALAPDNLNALMTRWLTSDGQKVIESGSLKPYSQYQLIFFGSSSVENQTKQLISSNSAEINVYSTPAQQAQ